MATATTTISLLYLIAVIMSFSYAAKGDDDENWSCSDDWKVFADDDNVSPVQCLWSPNIRVDNYTTAFDACRKVDAQLVTVLTEHKFSFVKELVQEMYDGEVWVALKWNNGTFMWDTPDGLKEMPFLEDGFGYYYHDNIEFWADYYEYYCATINSYGHEFDLESCTDNYNEFICERPVECKPGFAGERCDKVCHCHRGAACPEGICPSGCDRGWMGESCDQSARKPSVGYHCVNTEDGGRHVSIFLDTAGRNFREIQAVSESKTVLPWCDATELSRVSDQGEVFITIPLNDDIITDMETEKCAGKVLGDNTFEWSISIKEYKGFLMPYDKIYKIKCDFNNAESLSRTGNVKLGKQMQLQAAKVNAVVENVRVVLVDATTRKVFNTVQPGVPVRLQIKFFSGKALVKSLTPYDCVATTSEGEQTVALLDSNGCRVEGSPVGPFQKTEDPYVLETPWFPQIYFEGHDSLVFRCSFIFCLDDNCPVGCTSGTAKDNNRHIRSVRGEMRGTAEQTIDMSN